MASSSPRIAVLGFSIECNRFSPVSTSSDFGKRGDIRGDEIVRQAREGPCRMTPDLPGFFSEMDASGDWTPVPLRQMIAQPGGPVEQNFFDEFVQEIEEKLKEALPVDGVYIVSHGAALTSGSDDPDGDLFERVRAIVGPSIPIVGTFDLHANVSLKMTQNLNGFIGYLENPHTDIRERGIEAAKHLREFLAGCEGVVELEKLPLVPPSISLLTSEGPYAKIIQEGQRHVVGDIMNVSVMAGFAFSDCTKNGFSVVVTARNGNRARAREVANLLSSRTWAIREEFNRRMMGVEDAVKLAVTAGTYEDTPSILLADVADNPGGGGRGNTTYLLEALIAARARGVVLGVFNDASLADEAHTHGLGAIFSASINRDEANVFSKKLKLQAKVVALSDGELTGRRGVIRNVKVSLGKSALLDVEGIKVVIISNRQQCMDPAQLELFGIDLASVRTLVVKSRGHFRAGFDEFFSSNRIFEVDCPGLTSPMLANFQWTRLRRPVYPIDLHTVYPQV